MLLYYYINFRSLVVFCLFSGYIYIYIYILVISLSVTIFSVSLLTVSELSLLFYGKVLETFVILLAILLLTKLPVASAGF